MLKVLLIVTLVLSITGCTGGLESSQSTAEKETEAPKDCSHNEATIADGESQFLYNKEKVPVGGVCMGGLVHCANGTLSGETGNLFNTCNIETSLNCNKNGASIPHGGTHQFFESSTVPFGQTCSSAVATCSNGNLSGAVNFNQLSCVVSAPANCQKAGVSIPHGGTHQFFESSTVPFGQTCSSAVATCSNGNVSGAANFNQLSCTISAPANCQKAGVSIPHGGTHQFFESSTVPFGQTCSSAVATCSNGNISGAVNFNQLSCVVLAPVQCTNPDVYIAGSYTLESTAPFYWINNQSYSYQTNLNLKVTQGTKYIPTDMVINSAGGVTLLAGHQSGVLTAGFLLDHTNLDFLASNDDGATIKDQSLPGDSRVERYYRMQDAEGVLTKDYELKVYEGSQYIVGIYRAFDKASATNLYLPGMRAVLVVDGISQNLPSTINGGYTGSVASSVLKVGNDVYVAGYDFSSIVYWKNGVKFNLPLSNGLTVYRGNKVFLVESNSNIYIGAVVNNFAGQKEHIVYWKNGVEHSFAQVNNSINTAVVGMDVYGEDVYFAGGIESSLFNSSSATMYGYWKNGVHTQLQENSTPGTANCNVKGIKVWNNKAYVIGTCTKASGYDTRSAAILWVDGVASKLTLPQVLVNETYKDLFQITPRVIKLKCP